MVRAFNLLISSSKGGVQEEYFLEISCQWENFACSLCFVSGMRILVYFALKEKENRKPVYGGLRWSVLLAYFL